MKLRVECSVCGKFHRIDLRKLGDKFSCDACKTECEVPERGKIDQFESELKRAAIFGMLAVVFAIIAVISFFFWIDMYTLNPYQDQMHIIAQYLTMGAGGLCLIFGIIEGVFNRQIYF